MSQSLTSIKARLSLGAVIANLLTGASTAIQATQQLDHIVRLTSGTTINKADRVWASPARTLTGATSETLDLYDMGSVDIGAGAGNDAVGAAWLLAELVGLIIINSTDSAGDLTIGAEGSGAAFNSIFGGSDTASIGPIPPGGALELINPANPAWLVADTTNHLLKIASSDDVIFSVGLLGRSA